MFNACVKENKLINLQNIDISDLKINGGKAEIVGDLKIDGENAKIIDNLIINVDKVADVDRDKLKTNDLKYKNENAEIVGDLKIDDENAEVINKLIISSVNEREKKLTVGINEINTENDKLEMVDIGKNKLEIVGIDNGKLNTANVENDKYKNVKDEIDILDYSCNEVLIVDEGDELDKPRTKLLIKDQNYYDEIALEQEQNVDPCEEVYKHYDASVNELDFCLERILHIDQAL
ncbi:hypothetical protein TKK_0016550 [Trichogramma kaykai]